MKSVIKLKYLFVLTILLIGCAFILTRGGFQINAEEIPEITDQNNDGVINLVDARILAPPANVNCPVCVDVNGDKKINEMDVKLVKYHAGLYAPGSQTPTYHYHPRFDVNGDKTLDENDVKLVQSYLGQIATGPFFGLDKPSELTMGFLPNEILIRFKKGVSDAEKQNVFAKYNLTSQSAAGSITDKVAAPKNNVESLQKQIAAEPVVEAANKNHIGELTTDDPFWPQQWGPQKMRTEQTWFTETIGSQTVKVAVLDTGANYGNPDLQANLSSLKHNAFDGTDNVTDNVGHGTRVAGIIGATANNNIAVAGLNWQVEMIPVKVCDQVTRDGFTYVECAEDIVNSGLNWAILYGADVINLSLCIGFGDFSNTDLYQTLNTAAGLGVNILAGTGNLAADNACFPSSHPKVTAIGASNPDDTAWEFTNGIANGEVDYLAPGVDIITVDGPVLHVGTSMAAPHAAGVAALCRAVVPVNTQYRDDLNCGKFETNGYGRIDAWGSVWYKNCNKFDFNSDGTVGLNDVQGMLYLYTPGFYVQKFDIWPVGGDSQIDAHDVYVLISRAGLNCQ